MPGAVPDGESEMIKTTKFSANGWTLTVRMTKGTNGHSKNVLAMCKTIEDVQRCASMGDFQICKAEPTATA
jgi:hypothetical protein